MCWMCRSAMFSVIIVLKRALAEKKKEGEVKSMNMSKLLDDHLANSKDAARIDKAKSTSNQMNKKLHPQISTNSIEILYIQLLSLAAIAKHYFDIIVCSK